ncbi:hypothetical protein, partial [Corallococcus sp. CA053C]|uniref:hypothetical protein n=1 Tax=Corallococcus sp. CA053C TaxID=2316732 RepID=UPI001F3E1A99
MNDSDLKALLEETLAVQRRNVASWEQQVPDATLRSPVPAEELALPEPPGPAELLRPRGSRRRTRAGTAPLPPPFVA